MNILGLVRFGDLGNEDAGVIDEGYRLYSLHEKIKEEKACSLPALISLYEQVNTTQLPVVDNPVRLGVPVNGVGKIIAVGLNYVSHIKETDSRTPSEPVLFSKSVSALCGSNDPIVIPEYSDKLDWEVELVAVIGKESRYLSCDDALDAIAGYCLGIDVSERGFQLEGTGQWLKGKSADSFAPVGPWFVPAAAIDLAAGLDLWLDVNGERKQSANTSKMIHSVPALMSYISRFMSLQPGDLIFTGTPDGVGFVRKPPQFLKAGDVVSCGITGLGEQLHTIIPYQQ
jgi:2-keto-4-pentenoate hydratase/2-oxohepta-3-ene-1,7-dioic acid hydratase in catechol pathway